MPEIIVNETFWATALLTAFEVYEFAYDGGDAKSLECLGICWGRRDGDRFDLHFATATQLIEDRDAGSVQGPNPLEHLVHVAWAGLDAGVNAVGAFHSHPWSEAEVAACVDKGWGAEVFWAASDGDKEAMGLDSIEVIVSLRPLTSVDGAEHGWSERDMVASGRFDTAHVTLSGWYRQPDGAVVQVPVRLPGADQINRRIAVGNV